MATLQERWDAIEIEGDYIAGSLNLKNGDRSGANLKWLVDVGGGVANRKQKFFTLSGTGATIWDMTASEGFEVSPPQ